jgi:membrane protease YdiL (CAAX protease family)
VAQTFLSVPAPTEMSVPPQNEALTTHLKILPFGFIGPNVSDELLWTARAYAALAGIALVAIFGLALVLFVSKKHWLPLQRLRPGSWTGYEVFLAVCVVNGLPLLPVAILMMIGSLLGEPKDIALPGLAVRSFWMRVIMVASPLTFAATLAIAFSGLYLRCKTRPRDYGLSWMRWPANLGLGITAFLLITPVVLGLHALVSLGDKGEHPFVELSRNMHGWEWLFLAFQTIVQAPVLEEILFRGLLLGWLRRASLGGHIVVAVMTIVVALALAPRAGDTPSVWDFAGPGLFATLCATGYALWICWLARRFHLNGFEMQQWKPESINFVHDGTVLASEDALRIMPQHREDDGRRRQDWTQKNAWLAVYGSAMLFAVCHTGMWPAPVALIVLALVLGWLAVRTQSLIGPITLHALFNLVSFIALYGTTLSAPPPNGNVATTAARPSLLGSMINSVPASQLPLRK